MELTAGKQGDNGCLVGAWYWASSSWNHGTMEPWSWQDTKRGDGLGGSHPGAILLPGRPPSVVNITRLLPHSPSGFSCVTAFNSL